MNNKNKKLITKILVEELPFQYFDTEDIEKIIFRVWCTGRTGSGLRLTEEGMRAFTDANFSHYDYQLNLSEVVEDKKSYTKFALQLDRKIKCPYYVGFKNKSYKTAYIRLYDSKIAMMISLYGNFLEYLDSIKR